MDNRYLYYLGLDLGQARDYGALAIIEEQLYVGEAWADEVLHQQDYQNGLSAGWISPGARGRPVVGRVAFERPWPSMWDEMVTRRTVDADRAARQEMARSTISRI
jgi:hypothetical protein